MPTAVGTKGQVVIEKPIRDKLGVRPGFIAAQQLIGDHVEVRFYPPEHTRSLKGILFAAVRRSPDPRDWERDRDRAWAAAAREKMDAPEIERDG